MKDIKDQKFALDSVYYAKVASNEWSRIQMTITKRQFHWRVGSKSRVYDYMRKSKNRGREGIGKWKTTGLDGIHNEIWRCLNKVNIIVYDTQTTFG